VVLVVRRSDPKGRRAESQIVRMAPGGQPVIVWKIMPAVTVKAIQKAT
jgi:hypothetical protein